MNILLVTAYFRPHVGGIERFSENLAQGLAARGHEVTVLCCRTTATSSLHERLDGYWVERARASNVIERRLGVPYPLPQPIELVRRLATALRGADVLHVQDSLYASSFPALLLARRGRTPSVLTQHVAFIPQRARWLDAVERAALATVGRSSRLADVVATVNPSVAEWAKTFWGLDDVRHLPVGVPRTEQQPSDRAAIRRSFGLPSDRFVALFIGRDVHTKGLDVFLGAHDPAYELVAVTDRAGPDSRAMLLPFMSPERLQLLLGAVDAFVLSSKRDAMPVSLQEALARGLPIVTTRQPGFDAYFSEDDVLYVDHDPDAVRGALLRLAADDTLRARLAERAAEVHARHFDLDRFVAAYEELYAEAIARRRAS